MKREVPTANYRLLLILAHACHLTSLSSLVLLKPLYSKAPLLTAHLAECVDDGVKLSFHISFPAVKLEVGTASRDQTEQHLIANKMEDIANIPSGKSRVPFSEHIKIILTLVIEKIQRSFPGIRQIPGFPHWAKALPKDLQDEDIIKKYPNHLRGEILLEIASRWTLKEISKTSGRPELSIMNLAKRIKAARSKKDGLPERFCRPITGLRTADPPGSATSPTQSHQTVDMDPTVESEASRRFRTGQTELQEIIWEEGPNWMERNTTSRGRAEEERWLADMADREHQRKHSAQVNR